MTEWRGRPLREIFSLLPPLPPGELPVVDVEGRFLGQSAPVGPRFVPVRVGPGLLEVCARWEEGVFIPVTRPLPNAVCPRGELVRD